VKTRKLLTWSEGTVDRILERSLPPGEYRVFPSIRMCDVIGPETAERLPAREFGFLLKAHFDFVVAPKTRPTAALFAVEFDGRFHDEPRQAGRDVIKNTLCRRANLPLFRVRSGEISERDAELSFLDFLLRTFVSARQQGASYEYGSDSPFLDHMRGRLFDLYGVAAWDAGPVRSGAHLACYVKDGAQLVSGHFVTAERQLVVASAKAPFGEHLFSTRQRVSIRTSLPVVPQISGLALPTLSDFIAAGADAVRLEQSFVEWWSPMLAGPSTFELAEQFAEYLGLRAVEEWAQGGRSH